MGVYLNSASPYTMYTSEQKKPYFVDKTRIIEELLPLIQQGNNHLCITRPRRFGKTVMANMIGAFFGKGQDSSGIFGSLLIGKEKEIMDHMNQYNVVYISFNELPRACKSYGQYINRIEERMIRDLKEAYPDCRLSDEDAVWDAFTQVFLRKGEQFVFVLDEWDFIFHRDFITEEDRQDYLFFLSNLLKDKAYVALSYMTGILPIAKYSSGSELNMFLEFSMVSQRSFSSYFGFTEPEVRELYVRYQERNAVSRNVSPEGLKEWYDGYHTASGVNVYNPRSVVAALSYNQLANYWTGSGPYDEIFYYIRNNIADIRNDLALMIAGEAVPAKVQEYAATSMNLQTKDEIFSAMVVYGFLSFENGRVRIPNKELMDRFSDMVQKETSLGYVNHLAMESAHMLKATLAGNVKEMAEILEYAHNSETPLFAYNREAELAAIVNLVYLSARDVYDIQREDKGGTGYVDFIFYPKTDRAADCLILECKVDHTPEEAIAQIKDREYALRFAGKLGEEPHYTGRVLGIGIGYDRSRKKHRCAVEVLRQKQE